tara:strand:- start:2175 stop:2360 length:186 start_codon:yes stop_codon:yes gene_type:complete
MLVRHVNNSANDIRKLSYTHDVWHTDTEQHKALRARIKQLEEEIQDLCIALDLITEEEEDQ